MKTFFYPLSVLLLIVSVAGCGKKAQVSDTNGNEKSRDPSLAEVNFHSLKEIKRALEANELMAFKKALAANPSVDLNQILSDGETFLTYSIKKDFQDIRNFLIDKKVNLEKANINKETPLFVAIDKKRVNSVRVLLDNKVDLEKRNSNGDTSLQMAIKKNHDEIALILVKHGAIIKALDKNLKNASQLSDEYDVPVTREFIKPILLVEIGTPDIASFRAILNNADLKTLGTVVTRHPQIIKDYESINPLAILVESKDTNNAILSAAYLIKHSANVNGPKEADVTPLIQATVSKKRNFAKLYLNASANPQLLDKEGKSALIHAVDSNNLELVDLLLAHSAVENYTFRKDGKKISYNACKRVRTVRTSLKNSTEIGINDRILESLGCGFMTWIFESEYWD